MRIVIAAESFLPSMNGVTRSVLRSAEHLLDQGHDVRVLAATPGRLDELATRRTCPVPATWLPAVAVPGYGGLRMATAGVPRLLRLLGDLRPDVVHLAAPFVLGWDAVRAARRLGCPSVAVFQTDLPGYTARYGVPALEPVVWRRVRDVHTLATRTLAPSRWAVERLRSHGIPDVHLWTRGVDAATFHPSRRDDDLRARWAAPDEVVVGYVGRLAAEKQVEDLVRLADLPGVRLVVVGDGPLRPQLQGLLPEAVFTGWLDADRLAGAVASLDVAVHPGEHDTFGQTIQEAMASGVPVVAVARGGPVDLVEPGETGLLYPAGRLDVLTEHVRRLVAAPALRQRLGRQARTRVEGRSWARTTELLLRHYEETLEQHCAAA